MATTRANLEKNLFRTLNKYVEPAVRKGVLSPACAPLGLIVLESTGFKSGAKKNTPLMASRLGRYTFVSTFRGDRSFWVKNLQKDPNIRFHRGGKISEATSYVVTQDSGSNALENLPRTIAATIRKFAALSPDNWAFAVLESKS